MLAVCFGASLALFAARASAYSCGPARELVPLQGATFPGNGRILRLGVAEREVLEELALGLGVDAVDVKHAVREHRGEELVGR